MIVSIPTNLRKLTGGRDEVEISGGTIEEVINNLDLEFPNMKERLIDSSGQLNKFVLFCLNDKDIRIFDGNKNTIVKNSDELSIIASIAGG